MLISTPALISTCRPIPPWTDSRIKPRNAEVGNGSRREELEVSKSFPLHPHKRKSAPISNTSGWGHNRTHAMQQNEDSLDLRFFSNTRKETSQAAQLGRCSSKKDSAMLRVQFAKALPSW